MPGPSSSTESTTSPLLRSTVASTAVPGSVWRSAFSIRFSDEAVQLVARAVHAACRPGAKTEISWSPATGSSSAAASATTSDRSTALVRRLAAGVGAREQEQVGDQPAHPARRAQRGGGGVALLAGQLLLEQLEVGQHGGQRGPQLVRGVGDELALAGAAWPRSRCAPRRAQRASRRACGASSATSSSASGWGMVSDASRVRSISRAASVSSVIGAIARRAVARPASSASSAPPSTPKAEEHAHAVGGRLDVGDRRARTARRSGPGQPTTSTRRASRPGSRPISIAWRGAAARGRGALAVLQPTASPSRHDADGRVLGGREVVEVEPCSDSAAARPGR